MPAVTLHDVAKRAGVSVKTVSNVVNGVSGKVSSDTAARVQQAVDDLGYRPNLSARRLRSGRSQVIALAVPDLRNNYFAEVAAGVIEAARKRGYTVFTEDTGGNVASELHAVDGFGDPMIAGVVLSPFALDEAQLTTRAHGVPLVLLGEQQYDAPCDHVMFDNVQASYRMTRHLLDQGFRRIGVIGHQTSPPHATAVKRLKGHKKALREAGLKFDPSLAPPVSGLPYSRTSGAAGMRALLELQSPPEAVYCFADVLAFGAMYAAHERGLSAPQDFALAGFDGTEAALFSVPTLTTIAPDFADMARLAVDALIERIQASEVLAHRDIACAYDLVIGESTATANRPPRRRSRARTAPGST